MKGFTPIILILYILGGLLVVVGSVYGVFVYLPEKSAEPETQLAVITEPIESQLECPLCECPECESCPECPVCECEPEIIVKEVIKEVPVIQEKEIIVEVPVETIVYQDRIVYQEVPQECPECPICGGEIGEDEPLTPTMITFQALGENRLSFVNSLEDIIKLNHLKFTVSGEGKDDVGKIFLNINFPNSADSQSEYWLGDADFLNYTALVSISCDPNYDGVYPSGCIRKNNTGIKNQIRSGEPAIIKISYTGYESNNQSIQLEYVPNSIAEKLTGNEIKFNNTSF